MYVEIPYHKEGDPTSREEGCWGNRVHSMVACVGGVDVDQPEREKAGPEKRFWGGDVEVEEVIQPLDFGEYLIRGKKRHMNVGCHSGLPNRGEK